MLFLLWNFLWRVALPEAMGLFAMGVSSIMLIVIIVAGIQLLFAAVGVHTTPISERVVDWIFRGIRYIVDRGFRLIWRFVRWIFGFLPRIFRYFRRLFLHRGWSKLRSNVIAVLITALIALLII